MVKNSFSGIRRQYLTFVPTSSGFLYMAVVLDAWSRKIVGWSMANHLRTELVLDALEMAVGQRRPRNVIHHSDQGSQYTSLAFGGRCREAGVRPSMGSVGDAYDNAMCESFFTTLECELLARRRFASRPKPRSPASATSKGSTIRCACTLHLDTNHPSPMNRSIPKKSQRERNYSSQQTVHEGGSIPCREFGMPSV